MNVFLDWLDFKVNIINKAALRFVDRDLFYNISYDDLVCTIQKTDPAGSDQLEFETDYKDFANKFHALEVNQIDPDSEFDSKVSIDFTDKTTWFQGSIRVTGETLPLKSGEASTYEMAHQFIIDLTHGKLTDEDAVAANYLPKIYVDSVEVTSGFTINYNAGLVVFSSVQAGVVTADYSYASVGVYILAPESGKKLILRKAEVQFSKDVLMTEISFEIWGYNPYDLPNKVMYQSKAYKNEKDVINIANLGYSVPAFGNLAHETIVFPFNYVVPIILKSSQGLELRLYSKDNAAFVGSYSTVTFYTQVSDE